MWNYRIIKRHDENSKTDYYSLVEMFYCDDGSPFSFADHDEVVAEKPEDIRRSLILMLGDADTEIDKGRIFDEKDFEGGGRYAGNAAKWMEETGANEMIESAKNRNNDPKGKPPEDEYVNAEEWFRKFEVENKEDYRKSIRHFLKILNERHAGTFLNTINESAIDDMADECYEGVFKYSPEEEPEVEIIEVTPDIQEKMDEIGDLMDKKNT